MEKKFDYQNGFNPYGPDGNAYMPDYMQEQVLNPATQYEQMYMYYRYLTQQMEYKIRCIEYENLCKKAG